LDLKVACLNLAAGKQFLFAKCTYSRIPIV
jgi:hypothetical protein